jgi:translation elongation factor EF-G
MSFIKRLINSTIKFFRKKKKRRPARRASKAVSRRKIAKKRPAPRKATSPRVGGSLSVVRKKPQKAPKKKPVPVKRPAKPKKLSKPKPAPKPKLKPKAAVKPIPAKKKEEKEIVIGEITHFFSKIQVAVVKVLKGPINAGDHVRIKGKNTDFIQKINSMQVESVDVKQAKKGQLIGLKVIKEARVGDKVLAVN